MKKWTGLKWVPPVASAENKSSPAISQPRQLEFAAVDKLLPQSSSDDSNIPKLPSLQNPASSKPKVVIAEIPAFSGNSLKDKLVSGGGAAAGITANTSFKQTNASGASFSQKKTKQAQVGGSFSYRHAKAQEAIATNTSFRVQKELVTGASFKQSQATGEFATNTSFRVIKEPAGQGTGQALPQKGVYRNLGGTEGSFKQPR
jgi:hypothetical protein